MNSTVIGLISVACVFGGALLGLALQKALPNHHLSKESHEIVKLGAGMIATLTALVLGLLVSSAKGSFDTMSSGIVQAGAKVILLDRILAQYRTGSEAHPGAGAERCRRDHCEGLASRADPGGRFNRR